MNHQNWLTFEVIVGVKEAWEHISTFWYWFTKEYKFKVSIALKLELIVDLRGDAAKDPVKVEKQLLKYIFYT